MGVVYEAFDREREMPVALKTLRNLDATSLYRFKREFRALSDISHPNIVGLYELVSEGNDWFFTMELLDGVDFITYCRPDGFDQSSVMPMGMRPTMQDAATGETRTILDPITPPPNDGLTVDATPNDLPYRQLVDDRKLRRGLVQLAQALDALHRQGMVHRDLKPSNVRVTPHGRIVLMDFGIVADAAEPPEDSSTPRALGTPSYMAPEQAAGEPATAAADWYSFGVVLYVALTGRLPFSGARDAILMAKQTHVPAPPTVLTAGLPRDLADLCVDLLARDPIDRPDGATVLARLGADSGATETSTTGGLSVFVGRTGELAAMHDAYAAMRDGAIVATLIIGESGMGKSTLVRRFLHELEAQRGTRDMPVVLRGRCHERESLPYKAFDTIIDHLSHFLMGLAPERATQLLPEEVDLLTRLFPVLRRVPGIQTARPFGGLDPQQLRARAFGVLRELLRRIAGWRPLVLYIDDLQWADDDSIDLLGELLRQPDAPTLLLIGAIRAEDYRSDGAAVARATRSIRGLADTREVTISPLSSDEQRELVGRLLGDQERADSEFWGESDGSPFFLGELVRYAQDVGDVGDGAARARPHLDEVLFARIERLPDEARALVEAVSVAGEAAPLSALASAVDVGTRERERAAAVLRVGSLVRVARHGQDPWLAPYHDRIRETVTSRVSDDRLRDLHQRIALALERSEAGTVDALARHWLAAGDRHQATAYLVSAAEAATGKLAFSRAADLYRAALEMGDHAPADELRRQMANALASAGRYFEAAQTYAEAAERAGESAAAELTRLAANNYLRSGHVEAGLAAMARVMKQLGVRYAPTHRRALMSLAWQRTRTFFRGLRYKERAEDEVAQRELGRLDTLYAASTTLGMIDHIRGADLQTRHLLQALRLGEKSRVCRALAIEAVYRAAAGGRSRDRAEELAREVEVMSRKSGDPYLIGIAQLAIGGAAYFGARPRAAMTAFQIAERLLTEECVGADWERVTARFFICNAQIQLGELDQVARSAVRFTEQADRNNDVYTRNLFQTQPSTWHHLLRDEPDTALAVADAALDGWPDGEYYMANHLVSIARAIALLYRGDFAGARQQLDDEWPQLKSSQLHRIPWVMAEYHYYRARACLELGDLGGVNKMIRHLEATGFPAGLGVGKVYRGFLALRRGDEGSAVEHMLAGQRLLEESEFVAMSKAYGYRVGELTGGSEGERMRRKAEDWFSSVGAAAPRAMIELYGPGPDALTAG